jgi:DNA-binding MarR family transcriptional regulator
MRKPLPSSHPFPAAGEGKRGEEGYFGYLLRQAAGAYRLRLERALADLGVTHPQFVVLTMVRAYPGLSSADLARLAMLTPQTVSVIVANLERTGALERRPHAIHGRIRHLDLSNAGRILLNRCRERVHTLERELADGLSPDQDKVVRQWLARIVKVRPAAK